MHVAEKMKKPVARTGMMSLRMMEEDKDWLEIVEEEFQTHPGFFESSSRALF